MLTHDIGLAFLELSVFSENRLFCDIENGLPLIVSGVYLIKTLTTELVCFILDS